MASERTLPAAVLGGLLAVGLIVAGGEIGRALYRIKAAERFVTVKGLSEREVPANLAMWPIVFTVTGDDLGQLQTSLDASRGRVTAFLASQGFDPSEYAASSPQVNDFEASGVRGQDRPIHRYSAEQTVTLRSENVAQVKKAMQAAGDLVKAGVALRNQYGATPTFLFTALDKIKPEMIAEATKDARRAAEKFANDSGSRVGAIRNAEQGYFSIQDRDQYTPEIKKIRVVTTVQYFLKD